jgi:AcrR family transcriptional regulator
MDAAITNRRPGRPRSEATRRAILHAAYRAVLAHGYDAVTMQVIADEAKAGKQTLYRWWNGKAAVVLDAIAEHASTVIDAPTRRAIETGDLRRFLLWVFKELAVSGELLRHLMAEAQRDPDIRDALLRRLNEPRRDTLRRLLVHRFPDAREREAAVMAIYGAVWYRLLLSEKLDAAFAHDLAGLFMPTENDAMVDPAVRR